MIFTLSCLFDHSLTRLPLSTLIDHCHLSLSLSVSIVFARLGRSLARARTSHTINYPGKIIVVMKCECLFLHHPKNCAVMMLVCEFQVALVPFSIQIVKRQPSFDDVPKQAKLCLLADRLALLLIEPNLKV